MSTVKSELSSIHDHSGGKSLLDNFKAVRGFTEELTEPLETEDFVIQTMPDVSPAKWHLAHTSWFFEEFVLSEYINDYKPYNEIYKYLFNSYYILAGERHCRPKRGLISRPTVKEVFDYRRYINNEIEKFISNTDKDTYLRAAPVILIGINHEQQHQELIITDIKHVFSENPLDPVYINKHTSTDDPENCPKLLWLEYPEGIHHVGNDGTIFGYDNEFPRHKILINPFKLASRPVTNGEYIEFIEDGGYERPELWLSDGWNEVKGNGWTSPLYWYRSGGKWHYFTLTGCREIDYGQPICHISYYEADAYARWSGARLPTEFEWETAASNLDIKGNFVESRNFHPSGISEPNDGNLHQMYGDVWEWTGSPYMPYPGYKPLPGALGEYNGKFMCNQIVLRGGSCATSKTHIRSCYRNFFPPDARWQFSGIRLAKDGNC